MKQLYRIRCKTETCAWWYMAGMKWESRPFAQMTADILRVTHKGITTSVEPYEPEPLGLTASEIMQASETIAQVLHRHNPYT